MRAQQWNRPADELLPAVVQDARTMQVLMLAYMNREAYERTLESRHVTFFSRSRQRLWTKGEVSGNTLELIDLEFDCDADTLLVRVRPAGPACHEGTPSCFGTELAPDIGFIAHLAAVVRARRNASPDESYTARLFAAGRERIAQKVGEEATEVVIAAVADDRAELAEESADLLFHLLVLLEDSGVSLEEVLATLRSRHS